jgi:hypothetical protein
MPHYVGLDVSQGVRNSLNSHKIGRERGPLQLKGILGE